MRTTGLKEMAAGGVMVVGYGLVLAGLLFVGA